MCGAAACALSASRLSHFSITTKGVGAVFRLKRGPPRVDRGAVLDAALFGLDGGDVGAEFLQDRVAHAGLGGDDGDDVDHDFLPFR